MIPTLKIQVDDHPVLVVERGMTIGRWRESSICLSHGSVSRMHVKFLIDRELWLLLAISEVYRDGYDQGAFVIRDGDLYRIGHSPYTIACQLGA